MPLFNIAELLQMAVKDELTGQAFYEALAQATGDADVREKCLAFAAQEAGHAVRFANMATEVEPGKQRTEGYSGQYGDYIGALLGSRAFPTPEAAAEKASSVGDDAAAVAIALGMEKDTLLFFLEMRDLVSEPDRKYMDAIIEEERMHVAQLSAMR
jgi:rubrerythrin